MKKCSSSWQYFTTLCSIKQSINFTVNFQNTGNDTAFTVVIRDTLDADLDLKATFMKLQETVIR
ncbi:MAG: hypothetical protein IPI10_15300 [Bacteroidetes bacterium]|nr:hypothetical protein [Bacteroidota bacterium]